MTVTATTNRLSFAGDGTSNPWTFTFPITAKADLLVMAKTAAGVESTLVLNTDYTVSNAPWTSGGTVTPLAATVVGTTYVVIGNTPGTQGVTLQDGSPLPAATLNGALDRLTMIARRLIDKVSRSIVLRDTDTMGTGKLDAGSNEIINVDDGVAVSSAATVGQLQALSVSTGNVPVPVLGDVGKFLRATSTGVWGWVTFTAAMISDIANYALLASPTFTGTPAAPTAAAGTNTTQIATTAFARALASTITITYVIDGGGSVITTGVKGDLTIPFAGTITEWTLMGDQSGSIVVDIWKDTYANYPPVVGDSITASAKPTISAATKGQSSTLTGWTTAITAGDTLRFNVDSVTTLTRATLSLKVSKT